MKVTVTVTLDILAKAEKSCKANHFNPRATRAWVSNAMPLRFYPRERAAVRIVQKVVLDPRAALDACGAQIITCPQGF